MKKAEVKNVSLDREKREIIITVSARDSEYVEEPKGMGFPQLMNSAHLVEGINYVLEFGHVAVNAMKGNEHFMLLAAANRTLRGNIQQSDLATRVRQLLSSLEYEKLTDFQAKCVLLVEKELYKK